MGAGWADATRIPPGGVWDCDKGEKKVTFFLFYAPICMGPAPPSKTFRSSGQHSLLENDWGEDVRDELLVFCRQL